MEKRMTKEEAIALLEEVMSRVKNEPAQKNASGGEWQSGGAYWRLMRVVREYVLPELRHEGQAHAAFLIESQGFPARLCELDRGVELSLRAKKLWLLKRLNGTVERSCAKRLIRNTK